MMTLATGEKINKQITTRLTKQVILDYYECEVVQLHTYFSQGSVATDLSGGGSFNFSFIWFISEFIGEKYTKICWLIGYSWLHLLKLS